MKGAAGLIASVAFCCVIGVLLTRPENDRNALLGIDGARERAQADQSMVRFPNGFPNLVHYVVLSAVWLFPTPMRIWLRLRGLAERSDICYFPCVLVVLIVCCGSFLSRSNVQSRISKQQWFSADWPKKTSAYHRP